MSIRSILLGFLAAAFICGVTYFNNHVIEQTFLIGNHMPLVVFGGLILFLLTVNPLLSLVSGGKWGLRGRELAVIVAMSLAVGVIPSSGFLRGFTAMVILPHHYSQKDQGWQNAELIRQTPEVLLADPSAASGDGGVVRDYISGLRTGDQSIGLGDIPWDGLDRALLFWLPLVLVLWAGLIGLALVYHQQWAHHEHLPYPIAKITDALLPDRGQRGVGAVFRDRGFQIALALVVVIHFVRFLYAQDWGLFDISLRIKLQNFVQPLNQAYRGPLYFMNFDLFFAVVGVAYFLSRDVSFSLGLGPFLWVAVNGTFIVYGTNLRGGGVFAADTFLLYGAYFGLFLMVLYTGRFFYKNVLFRAVGVRTPEKPASYAVWGMRVFLAAMTTFIVTIWMVGLEWQLAILFTLALLVVFTGMSRIIAETGLFWIQPLLFPAVLMLGLFGAQALGPEMILIMGLLGAIIIADPREAFMPYVINALKIVEQRQVSVGRSGGLLFAALLVGMMVAVPVTLFWQYNGGRPNIDDYAYTEMAPKAFKDTLQVQQRLDAQGMLEASREVSGWARLGAISPNPTSLTAFGAGVGLVLLFAFARLRFTKWPLHPVLFLTWVTWSMNIFAINFLIGCFIKTVVQKYGGEGAHKRVAPVMIGLISGELLGALLPVLVSVGYFFVTGEKLEKFNVFPG
ncbi:MAG: DUF6785 family protein [Opitutales bacterium]